MTSDGSCPVRPLPGMDCIGQPSLATDEPQVPVTPAPSAAPSTQAAAPGAAKAPAAAPSKKAAVKLSKLRVPARVRLADLARKGMVFRVLAPSNSRAVEVVLSKRTASGNRAVLRSVLRIRGGGDISVRWRPTRKQLAGLKAGRYSLAVRVGTGRKKLGRTRVSAALRLTGRLPAAADLGDGRARRGRGGSRPRARAGRLNKLSG